LQFRPSAPISGITARKEATLVLDFGKLQSSISAAKPIEPRKIFSILNRGQRFKRPHDEQSDVLDSWFAKRSRKNNTIKMNTGSGKTLVGLLILQSSLNEGIGPALYITPDNYLKDQVMAEAGDLGINVTDDEQDPARGGSVFRDSLAAWLRWILGSITPPVSPLAVR